MAFYTDWYDYDYKWDHDIEKTKEKLYNLPKLMEQDDNTLGRPYDSDIGVMLFDLQEFYDAHKPNYEIARLVANILKKLCELGKTNRYYDEALRANISQYLELSTSVFAEDSVHLAQIKEYCESRGQKSVSTEQKKFLDAKNAKIFSGYDRPAEISHKTTSTDVENLSENLKNNAMDVQKLINVGHLLSGGYNTLESLDLLQLMACNKAYAVGVVDMLENFAYISIADLNKKYNNEIEQHYGITANTLLTPSTENIVRAIYGTMAAALVTKPSTVFKCKFITKQLEERYPEIKKQWNNAYYIQSFYEKLEQAEAVAKIQQQKQMQQGRK